MSLRDLVFQLLFSNGAGLYLTLPFVRPGQVGRTYFLYHGLAALGVCAAAFWFGGHSERALFSLPFLGFLGFGTLFCLLVGKHKAVALISYVLSAAAAGWVMVLLGNSGAAALNLSASALLLGFSMAAMWLGHWYLVQPKLSIDELGRICMFLIGLTILRFLWGSYIGGSLLAGKSETEIYQYLLGSTAGVFVLMRYCWGLLLPLVLCYFIWGTVRLRSTQSATGLLYVMVLSILTGEILSQYLAMAHGIFL